MQEVIPQFILPEWLVGSSWIVQYFFEQRINLLSADALAALPLNAEKREELWKYTVAGIEYREGRSQIVITAEPVNPDEQTFRGEYFIFVFDENTKTLNHFRRARKNALAQESIDYIVNPWGFESFFLADYEHLIIDWPKIGPELVKEVGIGHRAFAQKIAAERGSLTVIQTNNDSTTITTWKQGTPWWVLADKIINRGNSIIHIKAKFVEEQKKQDELGDTADDYE